MMIPLSSISLSRLEIDYAKDALDSGWISGMGEYLSRFERALASKIGRTHVMAVTNGTVALELALLALGVGPGDEVIVPALTFAAPAATVRAVGATPIFADVSFDTWTIDPSDVKRLINQRTKAIIAVDVIGHPCDFDSLRALDIPIIEDAAEAHGALYRGKPVGGFGAISTFSFHANKAISSGEGGCVATDDDHLAAMMRLIANHGMTKERPYYHEVVGRNYRMTNVTAAIALGQVERWDALVSARNHVAERYDALLAGATLQRRPVAPWATEGCWLYTTTAPDRPACLAALRDAGVDTRAIWPALCDLPLYAESCRGDYPVARWIARRAFWLPTWAGMPEETLRFVADTLIRASMQQEESASLIPNASLKAA